MEISGAVAVVTGAASGIGRSTAVTLARRGAAVVYLADVDVPSLEATAAAIAEAGGRAVVQQTDVSDIASQQRLFDRVQAEEGRLHILHNNAGIPSGVPQFPDIPLDRIVNLVDVNLKGVLLGTTLGVRAMAGRGGVIVNTSSITAQMRNVEEAIYGTTKAAIVHFTKCCAGLAVTHGVRVTCVLPGVVETPMLDSAPWLRPLLTGIRLLEPSEIAEAVIGLIEDDAAIGSCVTVANEVIDASDEKEHKS